MDLRPARFLCWTLLFPAVAAAAGPADPLAAVCGPKGRLEPALIKDAERTIGSLHENPLILIEDGRCWARPDDDGCAPAESVQAARQEYCARARQRLADAEAKAAGLIEHFKAIGVLGSDEAEAYREVMASDLPDKRKDEVRAALRLDVAQRIADGKDVSLDLEGFGDEDEVAKLEEQAGNLAKGLKARQKAIAAPPKTPKGLPARNEMPAACGAWCANSCHVGIARHNRGACEAAGQAGASDAACRGCP